MNHDSAQAWTVQTPLGAVSFAGPAQAADATGPALVVVPDSGAASPMIDGALVATIPLTAPAAPTVQKLADLLGLAIHRAFWGRPVVVLGYGDGAILAALARAPEILRVVAVDPPVRGAPEQAAGRYAAAGRAEQAFLTEVHGVDAAGVQPRDHRAAFARPRAPLDVVVSAVGLTDADRAWLLTQPSVTVTEDDAVEVARRAVAWAATVKRPPEQVAARLAAAVPRDAGRLLYLGPALAAFAPAYQSLNPRAAIETAPEPAAFDVVVMQAGDFPSAVRSLKPGGVLVVITALGEPARQVAAAVTAHGLTPTPSDPVVTPLATTVIRAIHGPATPARVDIVVYAKTLMDIRTRLPAEALRSDPRLTVNYLSPPFAQPNDPPVDAHVVVLQRPGAWTNDQWANIAAQAIAARQVLVIEVDDHPEVIPLMTTGKPMAAHGWDRYRMVHAIQTSTGPLRDLFQPRNGEVALFPNAVFDLKPFPRIPRPPRVFYGGVTRGPFVTEVARALAPAIAAYPDLAFEVLGDRAFFDALPTDRKTFRNYLPYEAYLEVMAGCAISLSPLEYNPLIVTKSDAKYLDAARAGVLTIASPTVYDRTIRHGENGLIAPTVEAWPQMLAQALDDPAAAAGMARAAWLDVRENRMFAAQLPLRQQWYASLVQRREALSQALLARSPEVAEVLSRRPDLRANV